MPPKKEIHAASEATEAKRNKINNRCNEKHDSRYSQRTLPVKK